MYFELKSCRQRLQGHYLQIAQALVDKYYPDRLLAEVERKYTIRDEPPVVPYRPTEGPEEITSNPPRKNSKRKRQSQQGDEQKRARRKIKVKAEPPAAAPRQSTTAKIEPAMRLPLPAVLPIADCEMRSIAPPTVTNPTESLSLVSIAQQDASADMLNLDDILAFPIPVQERVPLQHPQPRAFLSPIAIQALEDSDYNVDPDFCSPEEVHPIDLLCAALENEVNTPEEESEALVESSVYHQINESLGLVAVQCEDVTGGKETLCEDERRVPVIEDSPWPSVTPLGGSPVDSYLLFGGEELDLFSESPLNELQRGSIVCELPFYPLTSDFLK